MGSKQTEENDISHDPQTTERNLGILESPKNVAGYQGVESEEVNTERRFNSIPNNAFLNSKRQSDIPLKGIESIPNDMLETSNRPLNLVSGIDQLDDYEEEESKEEVKTSNLFVSLSTKN